MVHILNTHRFATRLQTPCVCGIGDNHILIQNEGGFYFPIDFLTLHSIDNIIHFTFTIHQPSAWRHLWNPWRPSWGEPYTEQVERMSAAVEAARVAAQGKDALVVSHQLPIWILRSSVEGRRFLHDPRKRQCSLASVTSLHFDASGKVVGLSYSEPAAHLLPPKKK